IHVDMAAFSASVEQRDRADSTGKPVIVGGHPHRGVVLAASYEVRPFGVRSAMPMAQALRRAPQAIVVPPRFEAYVTASEEVFEIFESMTPLVEPLSLDEAFLDVTDSRRLFGPPAVIAARIREEIARRLDLPASAGIAPVKFVAKIASDMAKPNGQREVLQDDIRGFLAPLALGRMWGVGPKTEAVLKNLGLMTIGDLAARDPDWLERKVPGSRHWWELGQGIDPRAVIPDRAAKSIGAEDTFAEDRERGELDPPIHAQALRVARRLRRAGLRARVVQLKIKLANFTLVTRRTTLPDPTDDGQTLYRATAALLESTDIVGRVRLTGVSAQDISRPQAQQSLFVAAPDRAHKLNAALDRIADRFGEGAVTTGDVAADDFNADRILADPRDRDV
ncbi:MAG: DNA polymerase IV, partial [Deltaproteobacteria bacterium]|nr:DNA polymerase IV [Deltaproteobacteria bacterium]